MSKCFEFRYAPGETFLNRNVTEDLEKYIKSMKIYGLKIEGARIAHGQRLIKVRCNNQSQEVIFAFKFGELHSYFREVQC